MPLNHKKTPLSGVLKSFTFLLMIHTINRPRGGSKVKPIKINDYVFHIAIVCLFFDTVNNVFERIRIFGNQIIQNFSIEHDICFL